jgi:hypothetical protein
MSPPHHPCNAPGCRALVGTQRPFCASHWWLVPLALQRATWRAWRDPAAWAVRVQECVAHIVMLEATHSRNSRGHWVKNQPPRAQRKIPGYLRELLDAE